MSRAIIAAALAIALQAPLAALATIDLEQRPDIQDFIADIAQKHRFSVEELRGWLSSAQLRDEIVTAITRPAEAKPWFEYRQIFLTPERINGGAAFMKENAKNLARAEAQFGVPKNIITAIIGVETRYGNHQGRYPVIDALSTLAFDYPPRAKFFRAELENYLLMSREERFDPLTLTGSYAGAMGQPQFMPSSFRAYAVDFSGDGKKDLWNNAADAIGSVGNYLAKHGWQRGAKVTMPARIKGSGYKDLVETGLKTRYKLSEMKAKGVTPKYPLPATEEAILVELQQRSGPEYWIGLNNFYVITRYNRSNHYAMAVWRLAEEIERTTTHSSKTKQRPPPQPG
jgi:membrane-bound lytic murein transglycosylase B